MTTYGSISQNEAGNTFSPTPRSSKSKIATVIVVGIAITAIFFLYILVTKPSESGSAWPSVAYSGILSALNEYKGTLKPNAVMAAGRPTTTTEATANNWTKIDEKCVLHLGYPWAFQGEVTEGAPVTLYFSKETEHDDGKLTGIAVHYYDGVAPAKMIENSIFSKGTNYDTIQVAFRNEDTDVCGEGPLPHNDPLVDVILAGDKGRISIPITGDAAEESGKWARGACLSNMGTHWEHDIVGGSSITFEAENLFPIIPMYDEKDDSFNGIFFQAPAPMQNWDDGYCGVPNPSAPPTKEILECLTKTNMWDGGPGNMQENVPPLYMCSNFCADTCELTGAAGSPARFTTMHWWFVESANITACATGIGPACAPK